MSPPRILLADAHPLILDGLRKLLELEYEVVGAVTDGQTLVKEARRLQPDLILLDFSLPVLTGLEAAREVKKVLPASKLIFWTTYDDPAYAKEAARIGASVYVLTRPTGGLLSKIRKALSQPEGVKQQV
ncbi:MAG TPA: response regulator transcription factor [Nitrospiraceae bacterium]|nr:response regulator transcription factor [Nitrospiraceae bacterium]